MKETRFKDTEIGRIPEDWEVQSVSTLIDDDGYGVGAEAIPYDGVHKYLRITDIDDVSHRFMPAPLSSPAFFSDCHIASTNDIFIARTGASVGKSYIYDSNDGYLVYAGFLIRIHIKEADSKFVFYHTLSDRYWKWIASESMRSGQPGINLEQLKQFRLPVPKNSLEQSRIASALTSIDNLIASLDKLIEKKKNIKQGTMQQLLTGKKRLKGFTEPWVEKRIIDSFTFLGNNTFSRDELSDIGLVRNVHYGDVLIQYGATIDASRDVLPFVIGRETASHPLNDGDIIMADTAEDETCGKVCEIRGIGDSLIEAGLHTIALRPNDEYGMWFLGYYMNSSAFHDLLIPLMQGTKVTSISKSALLNVRMMIPSVKAEQTAIAKVLSAMDNDIIALKSRKAKYESIKQGMMQQLLSGSIRLININYEA